MAKTVEENYWNRFFLDAGIAFWHIYDELDQYDFDDDDPVYDIGKTLNFIGKQIISIEAQSGDWNEELPVTLEISISTGQKLLVRNDEEHAEMECLPADDGLE